MPVHPHPSPQALPIQCQPGGQGDFYISSTPKGNMLNFICSERVSFCISSSLEGAPFCTIRFHKYHSGPEDVDFVLLNLVPPTVPARETSHRTWRRVVILEFSFSFASCNNLFKNPVDFLSLISFAFMFSFAYPFTQTDVLLISQEDNCKSLLMGFFPIQLLILPSIYLTNILVTFYLSGTMGDPSILGVPLLGWYFLSYWNDHFTILYKHFNGSSWLPTEAQIQLYM